MAKYGRLKKSDFGPSMPVTAPAVQSPPFYYRNMEMIIVEYRTDEEEALWLLPDGLELVEPATAAIIIAKYHFSTFGPYNEAILCVTCKWQGRVMSFLPNLFVTQEAPLIAGREIWGYAKKLAHIDLVQEHEQYMGIIERPKGNRIATAVMRTIHNVSPDSFKFPPIVSLKVIPNAEESEVPALAQLVSCDFRVSPVVATDGMAEVWSGPGSLVYTHTPSPTRGISWRSRRSSRAVTDGSTHSCRTAKSSKSIDIGLAALAIPKSSGGCAYRNVKVQKYWCLRGELEGTQTGNSRLARK